MYICTTNRPLSLHGGPHLLPGFRIKQLVVRNTVKRESLAAIIFGCFSNMTIWQIINLAISNSGISKDCYVVILVTINFGEFFIFANFAK